MRLHSLVLCIVLIFSLPLIYGSNTRKHYVVYMGKTSDSNPKDSISANKALLDSVRDGKEKVSATHHYSKSFRGFSAMLTSEQVRQLQDNKDVISVFESKTHIVHTTHSWDFLRVSPVRSLEPKKFEKESDVIIGVIDSGVWPESESFKDTDLGPVPKRFKGACIPGDNFTVSDCNRKIIGARYYFKGFETENGPLELIGGTFFRSARDAEGHGSHTASTAAGAHVTNASFLSIGTGLARGGAPGARLAIYKACWFGSCSDADLLSAFDDSINDRVDIISISAGPNPPQPSLFEDSISIGSFHAFMKQILVSASAGNSGLPGTASNIAPWILTVAASSIDRKFQGTVVLGNSKVLKGTSLTPTGLEGLLGIVPANAAAAPGVSSANASFCKANTLNPTVVTGKIVLCTLEGILDSRPAKGREVQRAGGVGMILVDPIGIDVAFQFVVPSVSIGVAEARVLAAYIASDPNPAGNISKTITVLNTQPAPEVAVFSSAGPNILNPDIIKPDITAPGMNILAAWSPVALVDAAAGQPVNFNIISGTSMSCPHVTGAAALVRAQHRSWSPAAIKSALMTTATITDNTQNPIGRYPTGSPATPFDYGSGHLNPTAALNPGLVYDYSLKDMLDFLCSNGATSAQLQNLTGTTTSCRHRHKIQSFNLNYPSIAVSNVTGNISVIRTVKNCLDGFWSYNVSVENPQGVRVWVSPERLVFTKAGEEKRFRVDIVPNQISNGSFVFGAIAWKDGFHTVRSPVALNVVSV